MIPKGSRMRKAGWTWQSVFESKIDKTDSCWLWTGALFVGKGYGRYVRRAGGTQLAHRISYELYRGPIPEGLTLDHLCRVKHCVNPDHLEPVSMQENTWRGYSPIARNATTLFCIRGHPLSGDNLYVYPKTGKRACKECQRRKSLRLYHEKIARGWIRPSRAKQAR